MAVPVLFRETKQRPLTLLVLQALAVHPFMHRGAVQDRLAELEMLKCSLLDEELTMETTVDELAMLQEWADAPSSPSRVTLPALAYAVAVADAGLLATFQYGNSSEVWDRSCAVSVRGLTRSLPSSRQVA